MPSFGLPQKGFYHPGYDSGRWYGPVGGSTSPQTLNYAGWLFYFPILLKAPARINGLNINNGTAALAGIKGRLGLYAHDYTTKRPGSLILDTNIDLDMTLANQPLTATFTATPTLSTGFVWAAVCFSGQVTVSCQNYDMSNDDVFQWFGSSTPWNNLSSWLCDISRNGTLTYATGSTFFPATAGATNNIPAILTNGSPVIGWRAA